MSGISYNVHPSASEAAVLAHLNELRPPVVLIFADSGRAMRVKNARPDMDVIGREWPDDGINELYPDPEGWLREMVRTYPDPRIILYAGNEPHPSQAEKIAAWTVKAIQAANVIGRRLCVLNMAMGTPEPDAWKTTLRPVLEALQTGNHLLGLHEYHDASWGALQETSAPWLMGRFQFVVDACAEMGLSCPPIVITEHGYDSLISDYKGWRAPAVGSSEADYADALIWADKHLYRPAGIVRAQLIFCLGGDAGWARFDVEDAQIFQSKVVQYGRQPAWMAGHAVPVGAYGVNVRDVPAGKVVGSIPSSGLALRWDENGANRETAAIAGTPYTWIPVEAGTFSGWAAVELLDLTIEGAPLPEPEPDPLPEPDPPIMTPEQWHLLLESWLAQVDVDIASRQAFRGLLVETLESIDEYGT